MKSILSSSSSSYHTVIIGGGVMGSSIALHLAKAGVNNVVVIEKDPCYKYASSSLSASGIRQQFYLPENIKMSIYGTEFLKHPEDLKVNDSIPDFQVHFTIYK